MAIAVVTSLTQEGFSNPNALITIRFTVFEGAASSGPVAELQIDTGTTPTPTQLRAAAADAITAAAAAAGFTISTIAGQRQILFQDLSWAPG